MIETARTIALIRLLSGGTPAAKVQKATTENLAALLESSWIADNAVTGTAYAATVPSGSLPWATVEKVGGRTIVWNQLYNLTRTQTNNGVTLTVTGGVVQISGMAEATVKGPIFAWTDFTAINGHKYLIRKDFDLPTGCYVFDQYNSNYTIDIIDNIFTASAGWIIPQLYIIEDAEFGVTNGHLMVYDLTLMFGSGNEPASAADFEAMFPADYYAYNAGTLMSAAVTQIVTADSNASTIGTYAIPAAIQALEGYGWSAGTAYNYVDYANKKFVQNVGRVDLGTLDWNYNAGVPRFYNSGTGISNVIMVPSTSSSVANVLAPRYTTVDIDTLYGGDDMNVAISTGGVISIVNKSYTDATAFKAAMSGVYLYYQLATPIETDISALLTDADALINVEAGGTVTFQNSLGDDYRIPVPSTVNYAENLIPSVPSSDGTYTLTATVSDGDVTYSWA